MPTFRGGLLLAFLTLLPGWVWPQQFMLPPASQQWPQPTAIDLTEQRSPVEQWERILRAGRGVWFTFNGRRFMPIPDDQTGVDRYRLLQRWPRSRIWIIHERTGQPRQLAYWDAVGHRIASLPDTSQLVRTYLGQKGFESLYLGRRGKLWLNLLDGRLLGINPHTLAVEQVFAPGLEFPLDEGPDGRLWFTTPTGPGVIDPQTGQRQHYRPNPQQAKSLTEGKITALRVRDNGDVLVGLPNEINILTPGTGNVRKRRLPLPTATSRMWTEAFLPDRYGNDYFSVGVMVCRVTVEGNLQRIDFANPAEKVLFLFTSPGQDTKPDRLWVRVLSGRLDEYDLNRLRSSPACNILDVLINGTRLIQNEHTHEGRFQRDSTGSPVIRISEGDFVQIRFTAFADSRVSTFRYKLDGFNNQWSTYTDAVGVSTYQPPAGVYSFLFNRLTDTGWETPSAHLRIEVRPILWKTGWFRTLLFMGLSGLGFWLIRSARRRQQLRRELTRQAMEAENLRQLDEFKSQFFANITHEFRTPLTIIINATQQLDDGSLTTDKQPRLLAIQRNANQLLRLINQALELARLEAGKLEHREDVGEPIVFIQQIVHQFEGLANEKQLTLEWVSTELTDIPILYRFDLDKLEKIVYNLLSNAIKFTPIGGRIRVATQVSNDHWLTVQVTDTGIGIPSDQLNRIFDRFHQVDGSITRPYDGTGIGLAFVKELTDYLGGNVEVKSMEGEGSCFTVKLPLLPASAESTANAPTSSTSAYISQSVGPPLTETVPATTGELPVVLVVEDNDELRDYVTDYLSGSYRVITAMNGQQGLERALAEVPDLVLSDVMMPELDGLELVSRLKADERTSHIPVVLLTAKAAYNSRLQGLSVGADDYVVKPFSLEELSFRIRNCLQSRQNWQRWLLAERSTAELPGEINPQITKEEQFLERLRELIRSHLESSEVSVDWLVNQAGMSRTQLHRKLTSLTGLSANRFIQHVRFEKAAELLQDNTLSVAQVAFRVGYTSPSHFTKVFQEYFGYLPTDFRRQ